MLFTPSVFTGAGDCWLAWLPPNAVPLCRSLRVSLACSVYLWVCQGLLAFLAYHVLTVPRNSSEKTKIIPHISLFYSESFSLKRILHL